MKTSRKNRNREWPRLLVAAVAVGSASTALAQYRTGTDGRARDASNQIGSGGYNTPTNTNPYAINGNQIVTGNVTGGREFRGIVPYTDPGAFRGNVAGFNVDRFVASSAGVPQGAFANNNAQNVVPFYGDARAVAPPPLFTQQTVGQPGYVPAPMEVRSAGDQRLGNPFSSVIADQGVPGQLVLPGPMDQAQQPTVITASPLYGVRTWKAGDAADQQFLQKFVDVYPRRGAPLNNDAIDRMRNEILQQQQQILDGVPPKPVKTDPDELSRPSDSDNRANPMTPDAAGGNMAKRLDQPFDAPRNEAIDPRSGGVIPGDAALRAQLGTAGIRDKFLTTDSKRPMLASMSPQYQQLKERLKLMREGVPKPVLASNARREGAPRGTNAPPTPGEMGVVKQPDRATDVTNPDLPKPPGSADQQPVKPSAMPNVPGTTNEPLPGRNADVLPGASPAVPNAAPKPAPVQFGTLTQGMKSSAAIEAMKEAEKLMRDGRYTTALDKFDALDQVAPNDPLVMLGRATAELGASYYTRADAHLREAFRRNPELLMGQYNLRTFLGEDRLQYLVKDLKDLAKGNQQDVRPVILLAYIAYNTGNERNAAAYLDYADKRAEGKDSFVKLLRESWNLPEEGTPAPDMNK